MKLSKSIQTRIAAVSLTIQRLVYDAVLDAEMGPKPSDDKADQWIGSQLKRAETRGGLASLQELDAIESLIANKLPAVRVGQRWSLDADAVAYGLALIAGNTAADISRFFCVEYDYCFQKIRRLRQRAVKV